MKPIIGSLNVTLEPVRIAPVTPAEAYFGAAQALMPGAQWLATAPSIPGSALTLVSGHMLECLLKAFLSSRGTTESELKKRGLRHNLSKLWRQASIAGLQISPTPPAWVERLSALHNHPFYLRYPMGLNGLFLPATEPMLSEMQALLDLVRQKIR